MIQYQDFICKLHEGPCRRGAKEECPKPIVNILPWCKWFVDKHQIESLLIKTGQDLSE